jgi:CTP:molybdopterin cytidylyltransferase MocA
MTKFARTWISLKSVSSDQSRTAGLVLAAGAGVRIGGTKGLLTWPDGTRWITRAVAVLQDGGCSKVVVVVGSDAGEVGELAVKAGAEVVHAKNWRLGMSESLAAGITHLQGTDAHAALVHLVDLPDVGADVVARVRQLVWPGREALARAVYHGRPGHPVLLGRNHWGGLALATSDGGGARKYLSAHKPAEFECGDLATGADVDTQDALKRWRLGL